jgi:uncharacterized protein (TIGR02301 family)
MARMEGPSTERLLSWLAEAAQRRDSDKTTVADISSPMRRLLLVPVLALSVLAAGGALAQPREPAQARALTDLAFVLGESHALRQLCAGVSDQYWRNRMDEMLDTEAGDEALTAKLDAAFEAGFAARRREFPQCDPASRAAVLNVAHRGHELSQQLSTVMNRVQTPDLGAPLEPAPDDMAQGASPR